jgi:hypothetical protein
MAENCLHLICLHPVTNREYYRLGFFKCWSCGNIIEEYQSSSSNDLIVNMEKLTALEQFIEWIDSDCTPMDCVMKAKELLKVEKQQMIGLLKWMNKVASEEPMRLEAVEWLEKTIQSMIEHGADLGEDYPALMVHIQQAKEKAAEGLAFNYFKAGQDSMEEGGKSFDQI